MGMETAALSTRPRHTPKARSAAHVEAQAATMAWTPRHQVRDCAALRRALIEKLAYDFAARRGFAPGGEMNDWLRAEAEVDQWFEGEHYSGD